MALGGYLLFGSLLLAVILAGIRLFVEEEATTTGARTVSLRERDPDALHLELDTGFRSVPAGPALWGVYDLDHRDESDNPDPLGPKEYLVDDPFDLAIHEITNDQYYEFLLAWTQRTERAAEPGLLPKHWTRGTGRRLVPRIYGRGRGDHPVTGISWESALEFCAWFWEERLGADSSLIVDLPTELEFVRAGREDRVERNFPWGPERDRDEIRPGASPATILSGDSLPVNDEAVGNYEGIYGLVGNAAEWVHGEVADQGRIAAGWSFAREGTGEGTTRAGERQTPFGDDMAILDAGETRPHIGFRIVIRHAPAVPEFRRIAAGRIRHRDPPEGAVLTPINRSTGEPEPPIRFASDESRVAHDFEITRTEITNHQYLSFLLDVANRASRARLERLLPGSFTYRHPALARYDRSKRSEEAELELRRLQERFFGAFGAPIELAKSESGAPRFAAVYDPGEANLPVYEVSLSQAEAYAAWLQTARDDGLSYGIPTVNQFLRAARGEADWRYPWGDNPNHPALVCEGVRYSESRPVSLLGRLGSRAPAIVGLAGNVFEYVRDTEGGRLLRAGGCFVMPANACTLDTMLDADWLSIDAISSDGGINVPVRPERLTGFRIVRQSEK